MDRHEFSNLSAEEAKAAHLRDLEVQGILGFASSPDPGVVLSRQAAVFRRSIHRITAGHRTGPEALPNGW